MKDYSAKYYKHEVEDVDFLTLASIKKSLRVQYDDDDELLRNMICAVCDRAESILGISIRKKVVTQKFQSNSRIVKLKYLPVLSIKQVSIVTIQGAQKTLNSQDYSLLDNGQNVEILPNTAYQEVVVEYNAGFDAETIPAIIKHGLFCHLTALYDGSSDHGIIPLKVLDFYSSYKNHRIWR